jgi:hypothetical protein
MRRPKPGIAANVEQNVREFWLHEEEKTLKSPSSPDLEDLMVNSMDVKRHRAFSGLTTRTATPGRGGQLKKPRDVKEPKGNDATQARRE